MSASAAGTTMTDKLLSARSTWGPFIGGQFVTPAAARTVPVHEAATGQVMASVVAADDATVHDAVMDARRAYEETWRLTVGRGQGQRIRA